MNKSTNLIRLLDEIRKLSNDGDIEKAQLLSTSALTKLQQLKKIDFI